MRDPLIVTVEGTLTPGHQVASGLSPETPFPKGTIEIQAPHFRKAGLNLSDFHSATLNIALDSAFKLLVPDYLFKQLKWLPDYPAETFSFFSCEILHHSTWYQSYIYYPHPETKPGHFQQENVVEVISNYIPNIRYGDRLTLKIESSKLALL